MKLAFYCPRGAAGGGGLRMAADTLRAQLEAHGLEVADLAPGDDVPPCDLVHFHGVWQPAYRRAVKNLEVPYVVSPHGMLEPWALRHKVWKKWPYFHLWEKPFLRHSHLVFATSDLEAGHLASLLPGHPVRVAGLGISSDRTPAYAAARLRLGWEPDVKVLLFLARLHPKKGLDLLLEALRRLDFVECLGLKLVVIGGGSPSYLARLRRFHDRFREHLPDIEWKGEIWGESKWDYFQGADLFCLPTHSENFGLSVLEAAQVGTPILTTNQTPWAEFSGRTGVYISSPNVNSIREQLQSWISSPAWTEEQRDEFAASIQSRFQWKHLLPAYLAAYRS